MKKTFKKSCKIRQKIVLSGVLLLVSFIGHAQDAGLDDRRGLIRYHGSRIQMGFRFSPFISGHSVEGVNQYSSFENNGSGARVSLGPVADIFFAEKYAFSTGLWYTVKRVNLRSAKSFVGDVTPPTSATTSTYNLQYLQIPLTFKMFTNEVADRLRIYVQFGALADIKLAEKPINRPLNALYLYNASKGRTRAFSFGDLDLLLAAGGEYALAGSDALFFGLSYQRGLTNVSRAGDLSIKYNCVFLDLGYKF